MDLLDTNWQAWKEFYMNSLTDSELELLETHYPLEVDKNREIKFNELTSKEFNEQDDEILEEINISDSFDIVNYLNNKTCCNEYCFQKLLKNCKKLLINRIIEFQKINKDDKEKAILTILKLGFCNDSKINFEQSPKRTHFNFLFNCNESICRNAFMIIHNISIRQLKRIQRIAISERFNLPDHGNKNRKPVHTTKEEDAEIVRNFIESFATNHGMPFPGGLSRNSKTGIMLPIHYNYKRIWDIYVDGLKNTNPVSYRLFINIWKSSCEHIMFRGPGTDLCDTCCELSNKLMRTRSENIQKKLLNELNEHVISYSKAREQYKKNIEISRKSFYESTNSEKEKINSRYIKYKFPTKIVKPCSTSIIGHYSFDFSQKVYYPFSPYQRSSTYFLVPRKCDLFGIVNDTISKEILFLIDELESVGKGANAVISYLHAFFDLYGLGEEEMYLQADNCVGQNKNKYIMWYLMWRTLVGLHKKITLSFMVKGHTKFSPDGYFGLFKINYQRNNIDWIGDVVNVARESSTNSVIPLPYGLALKKKRSLFNFYDWKTFLQKHFDDIPDITSYYYFTFFERHPGKLWLKKTQDGEETTALLLKNEHKRFTGPLKMPKILKPLGINEDRVEYLNKKILPLVSNPKNRWLYTREALQEG